MPRLARAGRVPGEVIAFAGDQPCGGGKPSGARCTKNASTRVGPIYERPGQWRARIGVDAGGHGSYLANGNACGDRTVTDFLVTGRRPAQDTLCR
ncbi:hypothetical protein GCM10022419_026400 [Nonomuraea rosea]|uniref:Peptidase S33 tripeptidyl aminopeptidase-like C-terminal domain-containing protein n=1 Tax=Nonomuraea rosea TaxID=638574 RepID=A0ABP6W6B8_9ACTN